jgi:hypothetical protein
MDVEKMIALRVAMMMERSVPAGRWPLAWEELWEVIEGTMPWLETVDEMRQAEADIRQHLAGYRNPATAEDFRRVLRPVLDGGETECSRLAPWAVAADLGIRWDRLSTAAQLVFADELLIVLSEPPEVAPGQARPCPTGQSLGETSRQSPGADAIQGARSAAAGQGSQTGAAGGPEGRP